ncbi:hypothetical protein Clacol_005176 [Clathrus columnatus]|uniref:Carboxypeptidase n=1 Tax=Clathrus columnatus TaxID=1419009 RepID=A0AAV5ABI4_9AGAM|nr:hypothetical protein Clacol_005176 [Clathrus columnatus]
MTILEYQTATIITIITITENGNALRPALSRAHPPTPVFFAARSLFNLTSLFVGSQSAFVKYTGRCVGTGYSTADAKGYIPNQDVMGDDVMGFLENLVTVFPSLRHRPLFILGESYAGKYIPYIAKRYFAREPHHRPVKLGGISMADGVMSDDGSLSAGMVQAIETYPQLINYDPEVYSYFREQQHLCGYDINISYPQKGGPFPTLRPPLLKAGDQTINIYLTPKLRSHELFRHKKSALQTMKDVVPDDHEEKKAQFHFEISQHQDNNDRAAALSEWKAQRGLPGRGNGVIDPYYECDLYAELVDWAVNFTEPWSTQPDPKAGVDPYDIPDATSPEPPQDASPMLNDPRTVRAIHAPQSKCWRETFGCRFSYPFGSNIDAGEVPNTNQWGDPSPATTTFLSDLFHNISLINGKVIVSEGNDDLIITARTMIIAIQNVTFGGIQGFSMEPGTAWYGDDGSFAGVVHQERGVTYVLFLAAGHLTAMWQPSRYHTFVKEFILGNNRNGTIGADGQLIGDKHKLFNGYNLPGDRNPIFTGSGATQGSTVWPSATIDAWESFIRTASAPIGTETETETYNKHEEL